MRGIKNSFGMQRSIEFHVLPHYEILQLSSASLDSQFMLIVHHSLLLPTFFFLGEFLLLKLVLKDINYTLALENATSDVHSNLKEVIYHQVFFLFERHILKIQSYLVLMSCFGRFSYAWNVFKRQNFSNSLYSILQKNWTFW